MFNADQEVSTPSFCAEAPEVKSVYQGISVAVCDHLARMFHELHSRDREDGRATGQPQGVGPEACLNGTSQGATPEDDRKDGHIRGRSRLFMKCPG